MNITQLFFERENLNKVFMFINLTVMRKLFALLLLAVFSVSVLYSQSRPESLRLKLLQEIQSKSVFSPEINVHRLNESTGAFRTPVYSYATQMRLDSLVGMFYEDGFVVYRDKEAYAYDNNDNLSEESWYGYDDEAGVYVSDGKNVYQFDASNRLVKKSSLEAEETGEWMEVSRTEYSYNASGQLSSEVSSYIDNETGVLTNRYRTDYAYNGAGRLTSTTNLQYYKAFSAWETERKSEYLYNVTGLLIEIRSFRNTEFQSISWERTDGTEMTYDAVGNMLTRKYYTWNILTDQPVYSSQSNYAYDNANRRIESIWESLDEDSKYKEQMQYDNHGNLTTIIESDWENASWVVSFKVEIGYDIQYSKSDLILPLWLKEEDDLIFENKISNYSFYTIEGDDQWIMEGVYHFHYSEKAPSATDAVVLQDIRLVQNPVDDMLMFAVKNDGANGVLSVVDMQGRVLVSKSLSSEVDTLEIDVQFLSPGLYLYQIYGNNAPVSGKFIKR